MVTQSVARRQPLLSAAQLVTMGHLGTHVNTLGMDWTNPSPADRASVRAQAEGVKAYHVDGNQWAVPSASQPGQAYRVMVWGTRVACSCECGRAGGQCKHAAAVRAELVKSAPVATAKPTTVADRAADRDQAERHIEGRIRSLADLYGD